MDADVASGPAGKHELIFYDAEALAGVRSTGASRRDRAMG